MCARGVTFLRCCMLEIFISSWFIVESLEMCSMLGSGGSVGKEPACQCRRFETWVRSPGWGDPLEEGTATHSSVLAWRISMDRGACRLWSTGCTESDTLSDWAHANENINSKILNTGEYVKQAEHLCMKHDWSDWKMHALGWKKFFLQDFGSSCALKHDCGNTLIDLT